MALRTSNLRVLQQYMPAWRHQAQSTRFLHTTAKQLSFFEQDRKSGYDTFGEKPLKYMIKDGFQMLPEELAKLKEEWKTKLRCDSIIPQQDGDYEVFWKFDTKESIDAWTITTDSDHNEGYSKCELVQSKQKTALFKGVLNTEPPKDGVTKYAGYCNIASPRNYRSFYRDEPYDWDRYTHLVMRVRGDGRNYNLLIGMDFYFDIQWNDGYSYALFTRGGPYWQIAKIPFSKFYLQAKGRVQDKQEKITLNRIKNFNIMLADDRPGDFQLEIDYIALVYDESHREEFAYEMYEVPPWKIG